MSARGRAPAPGPELERTYTPGAHEKETWFASPSTPSLREGNEDTPGDLPTRTGNTLDLSVFEWGDSNPGADVHYGFRVSSTDETAFRLYQEGEYYAYGTRAFGTVPVDPESRLRLELDVAREEDWWTTSTQTRTAWEFDSATTAGTEALPLLQVDYDIDLNLLNQARAAEDTRAPLSIGLDVRQPYGVDSAEVEEVRAWLSYDDGQTWQERPVRSVGGDLVMLADHRRGGGYASIKVEARDSDGNSVEQEVIRAYQLQP